VSGRIAAVTDAAGRQRVRGYDASGDLTSET